MTEKDMERRLKQAMDRAAPDDLDGVLSRCHQQKGAVIPMTKNTTKKTARTLIAACLALVLVGGGGGLFYQQAHAAASVISLDVNPSIEMTVSRNKTVLACTPLNDEAQEILADMGDGADLKGAKLDVAVNAIVGSLVRHGYLSDISSAILISVEDKDQERAAKLQKELTAAVDAVLLDQQSNADVLSQTIDREQALEELARAHSITTGKAKMVQRVMEMLDTDSEDDFDRLAGLSVEELRDMLEQKFDEIPIGKPAAVRIARKYADALDANTITCHVDAELDEEPPHYIVELTHPTMGSYTYKIDAFDGEVLSGEKDAFEAPKDEELLTQQQAYNKALAHCLDRFPELDDYNVADIFSVLDEDDKVYDVKFTLDGYEFEYEIAAATGKVLDWETDYTDEDDEDEKPEKPAKPEVGIDGKKAEAIALEDAELTKSQVTRMKSQLDEEDGEAVYEVSFWVNTTEYEYTIRVEDGKILNRDTEEHDSRSMAPEHANNGAAKEKNAIKAALKAAGFKESQITDLVVELDGGIYEVEFRCDGREYRCCVDAGTCKVLDQDVDTDDDDRDDEDDEDDEDDRQEKPGKGNKGQDIGEDKAVRAALKHAGLKESQVTDLTVELSRDHGRLAYEIEFRADGIKYEYAIDGTDGAVLEHETDYDD